jgi:hypothetical protein
VEVFGDCVVWGHGVRIVCAGLVWVALGVFLGNVVVVKAQWRPRKVDAAILRAIVAWPGINYLYEK